MIGLFFALRFWSSAVFTSNLDGNWGMNNINSKKLRELTLGNTKKPHELMTTKHREPVAKDFCRCLQFKELLASNHALQCRTVG